ncbi:hypothetical protein [Arthrobacter sp. SO5]|uniref:hypothetical protein n=1 Tax=Arthrobacter sp. SO5 TaxID=1897055 RepID=UPI001E60CA4B|nr:hypothetical protein [Arthrobacter sp. SO5]
MLKTALFGVLLLSLAGCSSYPGIAAVHRVAEARDDLPAEIVRADADQPSNFRLLVEQSGVKYFVSESDDYMSACIAAYPIDEPQQWTLACSGGITNEREIVTSSHIGQPTVKLVTTGFDTRTLETEGWKKIHENVLVGSSTRS